MRLGLPPVGSNTLFAPLFALYRQHHPGIEIRLTEHGSDQLETLLRSGEIDFAGALLPISDEFDHVAVRSEPIMVLLAGDHPLAAARSLTLSDLRNTPFILYETGFSLHRKIMDGCLRAGFEPDVAACTRQTDFMLELVGAGLGAAFLPQMIADRHSGKELAVVPLDEPDAIWSMAMAWRRGAYLSKAAKAWLTHLQENRSRSD